MFLMLTGGPLGDFAAEEDETAPAVAARCRTERSEVEGLRLGREVELREARWPGVWLRGIGGMDSVEMSLEKDTEGGRRGRPVCGRVRVGRRRSCRDLLGSNGFGAERRC